MGVRITHYGTLAHKQQAPTHTGTQTHGVFDPVDASNGSHAVPSRATKSHPNGLLECGHRIRGRQDILVLVLCIGRDEVDSVRIHVTRYE